MLYRVKLADIELSCPLPTFTGLEDYTALRGLVRLNGDPLGFVQLPVVEGRCNAETLGKAILEQYNWPIIRHLLVNLLADPPSGGIHVEDLLQANLPADPDEPLPRVTVAVCTRDRTEGLAACLDSLLALDYPNLDLMVVDNAPSTDATEQLVRSAYPEVRYVQELRPGLDWGRNRAIIESQGEIIAFTDDDVVVDSSWVRVLGRVFADHSEVMAVTGLVVPLEIETQAQMLFEIYGGFGRGFKRKWIRLDETTVDRWKYYGAGQYGTGANMAFRRSLFDRIGYFDPALDVGTQTNGGGDLEMFFRVLNEGYTLVYEPKAVVRHRHRRSYEGLQTQIRNNGTGLYSYLVRSAFIYPKQRFDLFKLGLWWLLRGILYPFLISLLGHAEIPVDLRAAELSGALVGLNRYQKARRVAADIEKEFGRVGINDVGKRDPGRWGEPRSEASIAVRAVDINLPVQALTDVSGYSKTRVFVKANERPLGFVDIANHDQPISASRLREAIAENLGFKLFQAHRETRVDLIWSQALAVLRRMILPGEIKSSVEAGERLPDHVPVSVVLATLDRPDDLRECLRYLEKQATQRPVEIVVVDNNPQSGVTPPVVAEFPGVVLVSEPRRGLAYARNAGFTASSGDILIATDDDVRIPPGWLEKLVGPFVRSDVMVVTGNVLPIELETAAQRHFENYGGLGRGFDRLEVGREWFGSFRRSGVPTWQLGATANAAFRASMFSHPEIGLMDEALGPGMPSGVGEDTYLFYKVLKAGYLIVYEPGAYVWHRHRQSDTALRRQIYNYSKGHVAYHLTTVLRDHDLRGLAHIAVQLPLYHLKQIIMQVKNRLVGRKSDYPFSLVLIEIAGNLAGPWSLWQSRRRVKREGHSRPYSPSPPGLQDGQASRLIRVRKSVVE